MAQISTLVVHLSGVVDVFLVYDDALAVPEDEGQNLDNCDLIRVDFTVFAPVEVTYLRGAGQNWRTQVITASGSFNAGGPVRKVGDLAGSTVREL